MMVGLVVFILLFTTVVGYLHNASMASAVLLCMYIPVLMIVFCLLLWALVGLCVVGFSVDSSVPWAVGMIDWFAMQ